MSTPANLDHLLEQYKLYAEMADKTSESRRQTNQFFISVLSALFAVMTFAIKDGEDLPPLLLTGIGLIGMIACFFWYANLRSYKQLNSAKFKILLDIEKSLPYPGFGKEWDILQDSSKYKTLTWAEQKIPILFGAIYVATFAYSLLDLLGT